MQALSYSVTKLLCYQVTHNPASIALDAGRGRVSLYLLATYVRTYLLTCLVMSLLACLLAHYLRTCLPRTGGGRAGRAEC